MDENNIPPEDEPLSENIRKIVAGVATLVALAVPLLLIRKLVKTIEQSDRYRSIQNVLS